MAIYRVQAPDGTVLRIEGPDDATNEQLAAVAKQHYASQAPNPADPKQYPEAGGFGNFRAGMGKAITDASRGYLQLRGDLGLGPKLMDREGVDAIKKQDAPLMKTGAGLTGNIAGNVAVTLPLALAPGVNTLAGAALGGAAFGGTEPVGTDDSRMMNTAKSAALFSTVPLGVAALKTGKALIDPMFQGGREKIVGRTLSRFAGEDPAVLDRLQNPQQFIPGSMPTTADASGNAALAMLENGAVTRDPMVKQAFAQRLRGNNSARVDALRGVAGDDAAMQAAIADRQAAAGPLYDAAKGVMVQGNQTLDAILSRPSMKSAWARAQQLAAENGDVLAVGVDAPASQATTGILDAAGKEITRDVPASAKQFSGKGLHYMKMALDDLSDPGVASSIGKNEQRALSGTRDMLGKWMEDNIPSYGAAKRVYAKMSEPINQMEVGQYLYNKLQPALNDFGGTARNNSAKYAEALRNADVTAQKATGFPGAKMGSVMTPEQMGTLNNVGFDLSRRAGTEDAMRGVGSNTGQNLAVHNIMEQMFGPLGLPKSFSSSLLGNVMSVPYVGGLLEFGAKGAEGAIQKELAAALLDPKRAAELMQKAQVTPGLMAEIQRYLPSTRAGLSGLPPSQ